MASLQSSTDNLLYNLTGLEQAALTVRPRPDIEAIELLVADGDGDPAFELVVSVDASISLLDKLVAAIWRVMHPADQLNIDGADRGWS
jgi:hypothetical protein